MLKRCVALTSVLVLLAGCSQSGPSGQPPVAPTGTTPPAAATTTTPQHPPAVAAKPQQPPSVPPVTPSPALPPAQAEFKTSLTQAKDSLAKMQQARSRNDFFVNATQAMELSLKVLDANPEAADRDQARETALQAIAAVTQIDGKRKDLLEKSDRLVEATLADTPEGPTAATAYFARAATHLNIERDGSENDPKINQRLFALAKEFAEKFPLDQRAPLVLYQIGENAQMDSQNDTAKDVLRYVVEKFPQTQFGQMARGTLALLEVVGKAPEIAGPSLEGSEINITQLKGKVVLVDFWATWCGPCVQELPNVKAMYDKYHEQGFEVLAVSLDQTKDALTKFVDDRKLPWPQIFFDEEGKRFWQNPVAQKYGINSIPNTFLVDRDGIVQRIGVRGPMLEPAVVELLKAKSPVAN